MADHNPANQGHEARTLLNGIPALQRRCDLDLLVFFARHWRALLSSEQLSGLLGYPLKEVARSRDVLVAAGLLTRAQDSTRPERLYVLNPECMTGGPLPAIVTLASTPLGRSSLRRALTARPAGGTADVPEHDGRNHRTSMEAGSKGDDVGRKRSRSGERRSNEREERTQ